MKKEPAILSLLVQLLTMAALHFGFHVEPETILAIAGGLAALLTVVVRQLVTPTAKLGDAKK